MKQISTLRSSLGFAAIAGALLVSSHANAESPLSLFPFLQPQQQQQQQQASQAYAYAPQEQQTVQEETAEVPAKFKRQIVSYATAEAPGTVIVDTPNTFLYLVLGNGKALRYGIGVGRQGFTWAGVKHVEKKAEWPDWQPPAEMIARQPYLPRFMAGGPGNPLGARAMYLSGSEYRIHGTNAPETIGHRVSSGCIRLTNEDVEDLYNRTQVGAKVVVLPMTQPRTASRNGLDVY